MKQSKRNKVNITPLSSRFQLQSTNEIFEILQSYPAIISGMIMGFIISNWIEGLNFGAILLVFITCICICEIVWQVLRRPHIWAVAIISLTIMAWFEGVNNGEKIIILLASIILSDVVYHIYQRIQKTRAEL